MSTEILVLCDERDAEVGEAVRAALAARGREATLEACDAAADTLGAAARDRVMGAATIVVVVREGGRGNRLLRGAEDEARGRTLVLSLLADGSPDGGVSARTAARIGTLSETLSPAETPRVGPRRTWPKLAIVVFAAVALALVAWLRCAPTLSTGRDGPEVVLTGVLSSAGWMITFHLREEAASLEYKRPDDAEFVSTGDAGPSFGPNMSGPHARLFATFTDLHGRVPVLVRYRTPDGAQRGPYEVVFDMDAEAVSSVKRVLTDVPQWVSFRAFAGRKLCYFTSLLSYKYALREIRYGVDTVAPNRTVRFAPRELPGIDTDDELFIDLPEDASSVTVELVYLDGSLSERKRFAVRY